MGRKRYKSEEIIGYLREAEVLYSKGSSIPEFCRQIGFADQTCLASAKSGKKLEIG